MSPETKVTEHVKRNAGGSISFSREKVGLNGAAINANVDELREAEDILKGLKRQHESGQGAKACLCISIRRRPPLLG
jgi:hypothetical protein